MRDVRARLGGALLIAATLLAAGVERAAAQDLRARYIADFERMRTQVLAMVDSMPASGLRSKPTPEVRDFAQQIEHVVTGNIGLIQSGIDANEADLGIAPEVYLNDKEQLARFVNLGFDRVNAMLTGLTAGDLLQQGRLFGRMPMEKWKIIQAAYEHGIWTLGSTVPYVRLAGGVPHSYAIVPTD